MKSFSKVWWLLEIISIIITFINPYIGIFAMFTVIEFIILGVLSINIKARRKNEGVLVEKSLGALKILGIVLPIVFLIITSIIDFAAYVLGSMQNKIALPFNLFSNSMEICFTLLVATIILNLITTICYMGKIKGN